ncbi:FimV/HubP family polar landmark protein [Nitrosomonas marina]|uniref:Pilus assembly protein FimV n=1 Tax=Nitrosomonas marina TaxID=917 RepID=A0A1H8DXM4_9PROT|nr:FimV/HubP family polar landmark protein [Nitrosomonas marina]SEN12069.1 pilus assembly protein FimV [Nitrosomonas marina]
MYISYLRACLLLVSVIFSLTAHAAGLGKLTINSSLGQPLNAEIDLVSVSEEDLSSLKAEIASREAFAQAGIRYEPFFSTFQLSVESRVSGNSYVKIVSPQSVNEPFLNMLVELSWASGRLLREYTVLLDPADARPADPVAPVVPPIQQKQEAIAESENIPVNQVASQTAPLPVADEPDVQTRQAQALSKPGTYGPILEGDTLSSIARQVKPESVNLNQMLVAIFRANRDAFISENMNLLKTGAVLKIPDLRDIAEITERDANAEVRVHVSDWHKYRQNLALSTQQPQNEDDTLSQTAAGEITTAVDNAAVSQSDSPKEVLRLSSGEKPATAQNGSSDLSAQERIRMMEEDAIARDLALKEANERVAMLEKNIENLQKLLSLQNPELAQAQLNAESETQQSKPETETLEVIPAESNLASDDEFDLFTENESGFEMDVMSEDDSTSLAMTDAATQESADTTAQDATLNPEPRIESAAHSILLPESDEASLFDQIMDNLMYIGAVAAIVLLTLLAYILRRRRQTAEAEAEAEEARYEELSSALRDKTAAAVAAAHAVDQKNDETDEFDQTNQFFSQDESQEKNDSAAFDLSSDVEEKSETQAENAYEIDQPIELDFSKENEEADAGKESPVDNSETASELETFDDNMSELESLDDVSHENADHTLDFSDASKAEMGAVKQGLEESNEPDDSNLMDFTPETPDLSKDTESDYELKIDFDEPQKSEADNAMSVDFTDEKLETEPKEIDSVSGIDNTLDFSVDPSSIDLSDENNSADEMPELNSLPETELPDTLPETGSDSQDSGQQPAEVDFSDINLDLEDTSGVDKNQADSENEIAKPEEKNERWHEIETKIDLAKAYLEMEDFEGAREMLEEVAQEGDENQQNNAKELLRKL